MDQTVLYGKIHNCPDESVSLCRSGFSRAALPAQLQVPGFDLRGAEVGDSQMAEDRQNVAIQKFSVCLVRLGRVFDALSLEPNLCEFGNGDPPTSWID